MDISKEESLNLIDAALEKSHYTTACTLALEVLRMRYLLSAEEDLLVAIAIYAGGSNDAHLSSAYQHWNSGVRRLRRKNRSDRAVSYGVRLARAYFKRRERAKAWNALSAIREFVTSTNRLEFNQALEEYTLLFGRSR